MKKGIVLIILGLSVSLYAQNPTSYNDVTPGRFDQGKMWTFENPPVEYFKEAYGLTISQEWMDDVRQSALRFASWCSASFISEEGIILTNHHCSRDVISLVTKEGENFDETGFYASTREEERKVPDLFVDQLVRIADVTAEVEKRTDISPEEALEAIVEAYQKKDDWKDLEIETRTFYSGGRYSVYGYKRYNDIRLVLYPELILGFFGGDPDNFTYPRYSLDFTLFRAYDEDGQPLKPSHFFTFNPKGAVEDEPVFVVGNPGSTGRYLTMAQLYYQRDVQVPATLAYLTDRANIIMKALEGEKDFFKRDSMSNLAFSLKNSEKAYAGRLKGYQDPYLMTKKEKKEQQVRKNLSLENNDPWKKIEANVNVAGKIFPDVIFLSPNEYKGKVLLLLHQLYGYADALENEESEQLANYTESIRTITQSFEKDLETSLFEVLLAELKQ
ncbi:MAG: S46 family peptidase, partial [Cyclobacteriaceae bacterium]|nr:S46 family peptidase [Cyclobacteriaceae bacterium]